MLNGLDQHGGGASLGLALFLKSPRVKLSCLIGTRCLVTGCLTPARTLHVRPANYRRSCCCSLALHALDAHGGHGVTTFETAPYQLWWLVVVLRRGMEPLSLLDRNPSARGRSCWECRRPVHRVQRRTVRDEPVRTWRSGKGRVGDPSGSMRSSATTAQSSATGLWLRRVAAQDRRG
jgi:hypothetical protein